MAQRINAMGHLVDTCMYLYIVQSFFKGGLYVVVQRTSQMRKGMLLECYSGTHALIEAHKSTVSIG